eukprot:PLAT4364.1.p1 GENE.PLAT4364.1~~PLAT4364.1.p1  ORF type:complete len:553 (-),score=367.21 PLAT4364.1:144-1802(-)
MTAVASAAETRLQQRKPPSFPQLRQQQQQLLASRCETSEHAALLTQLAEAEERMAAADAAAASATQELHDAKAAVPRLEEAMADAAAQREAMKDELAGGVKEARAAVHTAESEHAEAAAAAQMTQMELDSVATDSDTQTAAVASAEQAVTAARTKVNELAEAVACARSDYEAATTELKALLSRLSEKAAVLQAVRDEREELAAAQSSARLAERKLASRCARLEKDREAAERLVAKLEEEHAWIEEEKAFFGREHSDYDFSAHSEKEAAAAVRKLAKEQTRLGAKINKKVMGMIEKAEAEYSELMSKKRIIEADKAKIEAVIAELDDKKNEALTSTWEKVNADFGSIFSMLLPGSSAKLEPEEGTSVLDGLEVRVAFGGEWKESLTELSGGQRSLLALSLILSLLLFKPAPMYILDEIDAALDLSHTQNIGHMLKTHFRHSQFIIVSLKEGMFNNANVLFRTKFIDGISTVARTTPVSLPPAAARRGRSAAAAAAAGVREGGKVEELDDDGMDVEDVELAMAEEAELMDEPRTPAAKRKRVSRSSRRSARALR